MGLLDSVLGSVLAGQNQQSGCLGGLGGLLDQFTRAGAGNAAQSWVGSGANQSVSPDQVTQALGPDVIGQIASQLGVGHGDAAGGIAHILPELIDKLTPHGQAPQGGLDCGDDIVGMLGKMLQR